MKERPILFSEPMVRAILAGTKTQTRRVLKLQPPAGAEHHSLADVGHPWHDIYGHDGPAVHRVRCPYGQPGDRLWVRETWNWFDPEAIPEARRGERADFTGQQGERQIEWCAAYAADGPLAYPGYEGRGHWRPRIHMPRWASRITLEITGVRVERLQDISEADAQAEGCSLECMTPTGDDSGSAIYGPGGYLALWESINGAGSWDANSWVWVVEFKRVEGGPHVA
jgi:hypothetical protein